MAYKVNQICQAEKSNKNSCQCKKLEQTYSSSAK
jgi:hypothetical protein